MKHVLFAAALALAGCTPAPDSIPAPDSDPVHLAAQFPGASYCTDFAIDYCKPSFWDALILCDRLYGKEWDHLVGPMECFEAIPPPEWGCMPTHTEIICPGAEGYPSILWCCNW